MQHMHHNAATHVWSLWQRPRIAPVRPLPVGPICSMACVLGLGGTQQIASHLYAHFLLSMTLAINKHMICVTIKAQVASL
jgi:hypothetical protein